MKIKTVRVSFSRTIMPRRFSPVKTEMELIADISADENESEIRRKLFKKLKKDVDTISENIFDKEYKESEDS